MTDEPNLELPAEDTLDRANASPAPSAPQRTGLEVVDRDALCTYANFCRVTGTPEELIVDFALNSQPFGVPTEPIAVKQRIVLNYYTAKRLLHALHLSIQRHEGAFGLLETDVNKRVVARAGG